MTRSTRALIGGLAIGFRFVVPLMTIAAVTPIVFAQPGGGGGGGGRGFGGMFGGGGGGMGGDGMSPSFNSREFTRMSKLLSLDKDQEEAAKLLYDGYEEQLRTKAEPVRTKMERAREDFRENRDPSVWQDLRKDMDKFRPVRDDMEKSFLNDFKAMLREDQAAKWPKFERGLRREQYLGRGLMSGERVDLAKIAEKADLSDETKAALDPVMDLYEQDLDRELTARAAFQREMMPKMADLFGSGDTKKMQEMFDKGREMSVKVREVNRRYARQMLDLVPEEKKAVIADEFKKESYPRVFQKTRAQRLLDASVALKDLDETQKTGLSALKESHDKDINAYNDEMIAASDKIEMTITVDQMMSMWRNNGEDGPMGDIIKKRAQLNRKTEDSIRKILTPEQAAKLPKEDDNGPGRNRGDRGGNNADRPARATPRTNGAGGGPN